MASISLIIIAVVIVLLTYFFIKKLLKLAFIIAVIIIAISLAADFFTLLPSMQSNDLEFIQLPPGFKIETFADDLGSSSLSTPGPNKGPRMMVFDAKKDTVFVTVPTQGTVFALEDKNKDSKGEKIVTFLENLNNPHGIALYQDWVYVAEEDKVIRIKDEDNDNIADLDTKEELVSLPPGLHWTRTIKIINDKLYIAIGSTCNACLEDDVRRATLQQCDLDGKNCKTFASGLRNAVDFVEHQGKIYATENGRDLLGDDLPPDEINIIAEGKNYGWPFCYGQRIHDTDFDKNVYVRDPCLDTEPSFIDLQAHSAPLGLAFYNGTAFPKEYHGDLFLAYHGSWNRDPPTGYKIVSVDVQAKEITDFATGWLAGTIVKGRPVGIINFRNGLLISDDNAGKIYWVYYG